MFSRVSCRGAFILGVVLLALMGPQIPAWAELQHLRVYQIGEPSGPNIKVQRIGEPSGPNIEVQRMNEPSGQNIEVHRMGEPSGPDIYVQRISR